jgi:hypothetical protein
MDFKLEQPARLVQPRAMCSWSLCASCHVPDGIAKGTASRISDRAVGRLLERGRCCGPTLSIQRQHPNAFWEGGPVRPGHAWRRGEYGREENPVAYL